MISSCEVHGFNSGCGCDLEAQISHDQFDKLMSDQAAGMDIKFIDGAPVSVKASVSDVEVNASRKRFLIDECNAVINGHQWPSKLALGRMSDEEKVSFNLWIDYLDALNLVDPQNPVWPQKPK